MKKTGRNFRGFTLIELMVVVAIIGILVGILIPVVRKVRIASYNANTSALINKLQGAIERYYQDYNAYPGPLSYQQMGSGPNDPNGGMVFPVLGGANVSGLPVVQSAGFLTTPTTITPSTPSFSNLPKATTFVSITGSNNLVLGLLGGLTYVPNASGVPAVQYNPALVGSGPASLNPAVPGGKPAYIESSDLSWRVVPGTTAGTTVKTGSFSFTNDGSVLANDCIIPCFVDRYPDAMPILYLRARVGANAAAGYQGYADPTNSPPTTPAQYDLAQAVGYTVSLIGEPNALPASQRVNTSAPPTGSHGLSDISAARTAGTSGTLDPSLNGSGSAPKYTYVYPYDFEAFIGNPTNPSGGYISTTSQYYQKTPRQKDGYILISAGPDRIYGTQDDIASFGAIKP
jgi:prepilin-type N-terminal cleavage/methylation domain-containing protein